MLLQIIYFCIACEQIGIFHQLFTCKVLFKMCCRNCRKLESQFKVLPVFLHTSWTISVAHGNLHCFHEYFFHFHPRWCCVQGSHTRAYSWDNSTKNTRGRWEFNIKGRKAKKREKLHQEQRRRQSSLVSFFKVQWVLQNKKRRNNKN